MSNASPLSCDVKLREFLVEILLTSFSLVPEPSRSNVKLHSASAQVPMQCLSAMSGYFGKDITQAVLSRFCGFDVDGLSKSLSFNDTEDDGVPAKETDKKQQRLLLLFTSAFAIDSARLNTNSPLSTIIPSWINSR
jgi:hypothetical protein